MAQADANDTKWREYDHLAQLERDSTQMRYTTFTAFISISFLIAGLGAQQGDTAESIRIWVYGEIPVGALGFVLGFIFYCFSWFFYWWYHRYSHLYRDRLKQLEKELDIEVYRLRKRRTAFNGRAKFHFDWTLRILGLWYFLIAGSYAGWALLLTVVTVSGAFYFFLLIKSVWWDEEPNEPSSKGIKQAH